MFIRKSSKLAPYIAGTMSLFFMAASCRAASPAVQMTFNDRGLEKIVANGVVLSDVGKFPNDAMHIWHMKMKDLSGAPVTSGQYGWGENNSGKVWNAQKHTWTYTFSWGSIDIKFVPGLTSLGIEVTESNKAGSGVILEGACIYALGLHFPKLPAAFDNPSYPQLNDGTSGPSVLVADYGNGLVAVTHRDSTQPIYSGLLPNKTGAYSVAICSTPPEGLATFVPHHDRVVKPGETDHFAVSVIFGQSGTRLEDVGNDVYKGWSQIWPSALHWKDRRVIGTAYLASSPSGDPQRPGGYANNPRRYFNDAKPEGFDVRNADGLRRFQGRILEQAATMVTNLRQMNAQGVITWDIEGEEYPQQTSYVCSPDQIGLVSPEMESIVNDRQSKYFGMKLDDAYFKTIRDAGLRTGVCVRPQHFSRASNGTAQQRFLTNDDVETELIRKMKYAHDRWGATLFYLDSTVSDNGAVLPASIFQKAAAALPDSLLIPEETTTRFYAYTAPFHDFLFHGKTGTEAAARATYPGALSAVLINDADPRKLAAARGALIDAVSRGDILMIHADYWQNNNDSVVSIENAAHYKR